MIKFKENGCKGTAEAFGKSRKAHTMLAVGLLTFAGAMTSAHAVLLTTGMPVGATLTPVVQPGTVVGHLLAPYGPSVGGQDAFFGDLETYVVQRSAAAVIDGQAFVAGGLDFWVQVRMDFALPPPQSNPGADNSRLTYSPFDLIAPGFASAEFLIGGVVPAGVPGFSGLLNGTQDPVTVQLDSNNVAQWNWTDTGVDNSMTAANPNSRWLVLHTNDTIFGQVGASVQDGGVAPTFTLAPVPEPASGLFGLAIAGMLGLVRKRNRQDVKEAIS